jgi:hypothetical protein
MIPSLLARRSRPAHPWPVAAIRLSNVDIGRNSTDLAGPDGKTTLTEKQTDDEALARACEEGVQ